MTNPEKHPEAKQPIRISDLIKDQQSFEVLLNKVMLFEEDSKYYELSGWVTAALLDYEKDITIFAINTINNWVTCRLTKEQLKDMLNHCEVVVGNNFEESFWIQKEYTKDVDTPLVIEYRDKKYMSDESLIWETQLDNKYNIYVHRVGDYKGVLTINEGDKEIHRKEVPLSYNAQFGPDIADISYWQAYCVDVVDNPSKYVI